MELLTPELRARIPALYSQEHVKLADKIVYAKFFFPAGKWTWFVTEGDEEDDDYRMFGFVIGFEEEWDCFSLNELQSIEVKSLSIERDVYFKEGRFEDVLNQFNEERGL